MRALMHEIAISVLGDETEDYIVGYSKVEALEYLKNLTQEDFGQDCDKWREWFETCPADLLDLYQSEYFRNELIRTRPERLQDAEASWGKVTERRCPHCGGLCPEYKKRCWVCFEIIGRVPSVPENNSCPNPPTPI